MPQQHQLHNEEQLQNFCELVRADWLEGKKPVWERVDPASSGPQYRALHVWLGDCAEFLNSSGMDMRKVMAQKEVEAPWSKASFKEAIWKPILEAMTTKDSTKDQTTVECQKVAETIRRHFASKMGVNLPAWPDRHNRGREA